MGQAERHGPSPERQRANDQNRSRPAAIDEATHDDADDPSPTVKEHRTDRQCGARPAVFALEESKKHSLVKDPDAPRHEGDEVTDADDIPTVIEPSALETCHAA